MCYHLWLWTQPLEWCIVWHTENHLLIPTFRAFIFRAAFTLWYAFVHAQGTRWETTLKFWTYNWTKHTCAIYAAVLGSERVAILVFNSIIHASCKVWINFVHKAVNGGFNEEIAKKVEPCNFQIITMMCIKLYNSGMEIGQRISFWYQILLKMLQKWQKKSLFGIFLFFLDKLKVITLSYKW